MTKLGEGILLDFEERKAAEELTESVLNDPEGAAYEIVGLRKYADLLACGLSDSEARSTVWK